MPPAEVGTMAATGFIQWLLALVLLGGGGLVAWAIRTIVSRFSGAMDKTEAAMERIGQTLAAVETSIDAGHEKLLAKVDVATIAQTERLILEAERQTNRVLKELELVHREFVLKLMEGLKENRHDARNAITVVANELAAVHASLLADSGRRSPSLKPKEIDHA